MFPICQNSISSYLNLVFWGMKFTVLVYKALSSFFICFQYIRIPFYLTLILCFGDWNSLYWSIKHWALSSYSSNISSFHHEFFSPFKSKSFPGSIKNTQDFGWDRLISNYIYLFRKKNLLGKTFTLNNGKEFYTVLVTGGERERK